METTKLKFTLLQADIFRFLCENVGREVNQSLIAKELDVSSTGVAKALKSLEKEELISVKRNNLMNLNIIQLNRENPKAVQLKRVENLKAVYESGLVENLEEIFLGSTIILFGSYSYGEDTIKSDIDIAVIGCKDKKINLDNFEKFLKKEIRINFYEDFKKIHKHLKESICNGIILKGGVEL